MDITVKRKNLKGKISAMPSKSYAHRILICSFLSGAKIDREKFSFSQDICATLSCIEELRNKFPRLNCKESGSTLRFLLPIVSALGIEAEFFAEGRLPQRPLSPFIEELESHGAVFSGETLPFKISGKLKSGTYTLPGNISSQYISALLFALPILKGDSRIIIDGKIESLGYIDLTEDILKRFNIDTEKTDFGYFIRGNQKYKAPKDINIDGDWSNAAVFLAMDALGADIEILNLSKNTLQCDREILNILLSLGAAEKGCRGIKIEAKKNLKPFNIDVSQYPDLFPILAVLACGIEGESLLYNAQRLRIKESDRIKAMCSLINSLGGKAHERSDSLLIEGRGSLCGGVVDSFNDHRIVMAAFLSSLICKNDVTIKNAQYINKSYPNFFEDFISLGGKINVIDNRE